VAVPARFHILSGARSPAAEFELAERSPASALAAIGDVVVLQVIDALPRLVAFDLASQPPRQIWEHILRADLVGAPLLGKVDAATGRAELVYLDRAGRLVSLSVPTADADPSRAALLTFNWAVQLPEAAELAGAPALGDANRVYVAAGSTIAAFSRSDGAESWSIDIAPDAATGSVTLGPGGVLYVGTRFGRLLAIATESQGLDPEAAWPALRHDARNTGRAGW